MRNDFKHIHDIDRVLRSSNREVEDLIEKKVQVHAMKFLSNSNEFRPNL